MKWDVSELELVQKTISTLLGQRKGQRGQGQQHKHSWADSLASPTQ